jgi:hypothetical protein
VWVRVTETVEAVDLVEVVGSRVLDGGRRVLRVTVAPHSSSEISSGQQPLSLQYDPERHTAVYHSQLPLGYLI